MGQNGHDAVPVAGRGGRPAREVAQAANRAGWTTGATSHGRGRAAASECTPANQTPDRSAASHDLDSDPGVALVGQEVGGVLPGVWPEIATSVKERDE